MNKYMDSKEQLLIEIPEEMYLYLKETSEISGTSINSLIFQALRGFKAVFECDYRNKNKNKYE